MANLTFSFLVLGAIALKFFATLFGHAWMGVAYLVLAVLLSALKVKLHCFGENNCFFVNVGGGILPLGLALGLGWRLAAEIGWTELGLLSALTVLPATLIGHFSSHFKKDAGVMTDSILVLPVCVFLLVRYATAWAGDLALDTYLVRVYLGFIVGTLAAFVGCDLLKLPAIQRYCGGHDRSLIFGGGGITDVVFSTGLITAIFFL